METNNLYDVEPQPISEETIQRIEDAMSVASEGTTLFDPDQSADIRRYSYQEIELKNGNKISAFAINPEFKEIDFDYEGEYEAYKEELSTNPAPNPNSIKYVVQIVEQGEDIFTQPWDLLTTYTYSHNGQVNKFMTPGPMSDSKKEPITIDSIIDGSYTIDFLDPCLLFEVSEQESNELINLLYQYCYYREDVKTRLDPGGQISIDEPYEY